MKAYEEGYKAGLAEMELWENPYSGEKCMRVDFDYWFAGWCNGMKARNLSRVEG